MPDQLLLTPEKTSWLQCCVSYNREYGKYLCSQVKGNTLHFVLVHLVPDGSLGCARMSCKGVDALALEATHSAYADVRYCMHCNCMQSVLSNDHHNNDLVLVGQQHRLATSTRRHATASAAT